MPIKNTPFPIIGILNFFLWVGESKSSISVFTVSILFTELVSIGKMDNYLQTANLALEEWCKCGDLQQEKESLLKEMNKAKEKKDAEIDSLNREQSVLRPILNKRTILFS